MLTAAGYDTRPYDREYLAQAPGAERVTWRFDEFRLSTETAPATKGAQAVCIFVNDQADRACLEILAGLGVKLLALRCAGFNNVDRDALLAASDIISLHVPLLPDTRRLLNEQTLARMKPGVFIVSTSRGKLIDTSALKNGQIGGVALDVYEEEEGILFEDLSGQVLHDDELSLLLNVPNVLITAHQAFLTREALSGIARVITANVLLLESGEVSASWLEGTLLT